MKNLIIPGLLAAACLPVLAQQLPTPQTSVSDARAAAGATGYCVFESRNAYYQGSPAEPIKLVWRTSDGEVQSWDWLHGGVPWFSFAANKGTAKQDFYYYLLDVGITTAGYTSTRYSLKGYIAENIAWPAATFAVIYEGTGTAWFVAHGTLTCS
jgi:hypothetical protein